MSLCVFEVAIWVGAPLIVTAWNNWFILPVIHSSSQMWLAWTLRELPIPTAVDMCCTHWNHFGVKWVNCMYLLFAFRIYHVEFGSIIRKHFGIVQTQLEGGHAWMESLSFLSSTLPTASSPLVHPCFTQLFAFLNPSDTLQVCRYQLLQIFVFTIWQIQLEFCVWL